MASFDFITGEDFKTSLEKDFKEMNLCIQTGAYKAAVVIAGSIVEAVLIDYVIAENIVVREDALKLDFGKVLTLCKDKKIISEKASDLSSAIKGYRNLIHPGRALRLNESVDKDSAEVSKALVNIVLGEIEKLKKENYGYTAEQILAKIKSDSNTRAILELLIKKTNSKELERLMLKLLPNAYHEEFRLQESRLMAKLYSEDDDWEFSSKNPHLMSTLIDCFRISFSHAGQDVRKKVVDWYAQVIKEEGESVISSYGTAFFNATYMFQMDSEDAEIVKHYILGQMKNNMNRAILNGLFGLGSFLKNGDVAAYIDPLVRSISRENVELEEEEYTRSLLLIETSYDTFDPEIRKDFMERLELWENTFRSKGQEEKAEKVRKLKESIYIPLEKGDG
jgi:hypothetical protein